MFETSQPNSEWSQDHSPQPKPPSEPVFRTLEQFSDWLDQQLIALEDRHPDFSTKRSVRGYLQR